MVADVKACEHQACEHVMEGVWNKRRGTSANLRIQLLLATAQLTPALLLTESDLNLVPKKIRKEPEKTPDILHLEQFRTPCTGLEAIKPFLSFNTLL